MQETPVRYAHHFLIGLQPAWCNNTGRGEYPGDYSPQIGGRNIADILALAHFRFKLFHVHQIFTHFGDHSTGSSGSLLMENHLSKSLRGMESLPLSLTILEQQRKHCDKIQVFLL